MITVTVLMKVDKEPVKRVPVALQFDADEATTPAVWTDRDGVARFDLPPRSGKVLVAGIERYHGVLDERVTVELWSVTSAPDVSAGAPGGLQGGSTAYPGMQTRKLSVGDKEVLTDAEGYLIQASDWSESFVRAEAAVEGLMLNDEHWQVIRFLRQYFEAHGVQASVREMIKHFRDVWGREKGSNRYLHRLFPAGGPQKQGNRLAGLLRTKGEH
jgi:tRNA 2-thiouridine synthesizing protein E